VFLFKKGLCPSSGDIYRPMLMDCYCGPRQSGRESFHKKVLCPSSEAMMVNHELILLSLYKLVGKMQQWHLNFVSKEYFDGSYEYCSISYTNNMSVSVVFVGAIHLIVLVA
jgi:hypothetical protein